MKDCGKITKIDHENITIEVGPREECHKCGACHGAKKNQIVIPFNTEYENLKLGDNVELVIDDSIMLKICLLIYGVPLIVFLAVLFLAYFFTKHPLISFSSAILAIAISYVLLGRYTKTHSSFLPRILRIF